MRFLHISTFIIVIVLTAFSCQKPATSVAGKGGSANVTVSIKHHGTARNLYKCKVYIKYNTVETPPNGIYDDSLTTNSADTMQTAVFSGLKNGNYYLYAYGCDTSIFQHVDGGLPYTISSQSNLSDNLPVTEHGLPCN